MRRSGLFSVLVTVVIMTGLTSARAADSVVATVSVDARGAVTTVNVGPGTYRVTSNGTYNYDFNTPGTHLADAFCSTGDFAYWRGTVDGVGHLTGLEPSTVSEWQPFRYGYGTTGSGLLDTGIGISGWTSGQPLDQVLELRVNGAFTPWVAAPSVLDPRGALTSCDTATHAYTTALISRGGPARFQIRDTNYVDNSGSLTVTITRLLS